MDMELIVEGEAPTVEHSWGRHQSRKPSEYCMDKLWPQQEVTELQELFFG